LESFVFLAWIFSGTAEKVEHLDNGQGFCLSSDDSTGESQAGIKLSIFIERRDESSSFDNFFYFIFFYLL